MGKKINAEKVLPLLIYPENLPFLLREVKLPHSSNEIMNNLRTRMGGTIAFQQNPFQGIALYTGLLILALIALVATILITRDFLLDPTIAVFRRGGRRIAFGVAGGAFLGLGSLIWILSKTLFNAIRYSPAKLKQNYALMLHQGAPIKGTILSTSYLNGIHVITYQFATPEGKTLQCEYRSPRLKYKKNENVTGKNVLVLYLSDTINTLL